MLSLPQAGLRAAVGRHTSAVYLRFSGAITFRRWPRQICSRISLTQDPRGVIIIQGLLQGSDAGLKLFVSQLFQRLRIPPIDLVQDGSGFSPCRYLSPHVQTVQAGLEADNLHERFGCLEVTSQDLRPDGLDCPLQPRTLHLPHLIDGLFPSHSLPMSF